VTELSNQDDDERNDSAGPRAHSRRSSRYDNGQTATVTTIETEHLDFGYANDKLVLSDVGLRVEQGSIYGFLGPNGAGKTTTLRLILGLLKRQHGSISIFGKSFEQHRVEILRNIGSLIESPSLYGHLTATENLALLRNIHQCPKTRVDEVLELVGLSKTGRKKAGQFSLGMKQRLSIAIALLHQPPLLVLDEPTNGLDPTGIIEMRELLRGLNQENGTTIVISSHLLSEIERLVTHVGIINKGRMMFQGTLDDLRAMQTDSSSVVFETSDVAKTMQVIADCDLRSSIKNGKVAMQACPRETIASVNKRLVSSGVEVYQISVVENDLETIFIDLVSN
jgi:ABC-type multidrug transport system ATPase subunit